jgi:anti-sigma regulatory factor (Ser/Thr protein kinase)
MMAPEFSMTLPRDRSAAAMARTALRERFLEALGEKRVSELALVVTELVANAVVHGRGAINLEIRADGERVHGEVVDQGGGFEREVRERGSAEVGGRGLVIVDALSSRWGIHEGTTHVWFELGSRDEPPKRSEPELGDTERPTDLD